MGKLNPIKKSKIEIENPMINKVGKKNVNLLYSGYQLSNIGRALPNLLTCKENLSQSILLLWYTKALGNNLVSKPNFHNRIDKSGSSPG